MGRRGISLLRLFIVLTLSVVFLTAQVFAEDAETQTDSEETTAPAVATVENEPKTEIVTVKEEGSKVETDKVVALETEEKQNVPESIDLRFLSAHVNFSDRTRVYIKLDEEQAQKIRFKDPNGNKIGLFEVEFDSILGGELQQKPSYKSKDTFISEGFIIISTDKRINYLTSKVRIKYIGKDDSESSALMIGDQPVKKMENPIELELDQKDFISSVKLSRAVAANENRLRELILTTTGDLNYLTSEDQVKVAIEGFSVQLESKKSKDLSVHRFIYAEGNEIKLELSRDVIYGEKFSVIYDPAKLTIDDYRLRDKTDRRFVEGKTLSVVNLADPIIINISDFRIDPIKKGQEGKATIKLSSFELTDFTKFDIEQDEVKLTGATLVSIQKSDDNVFTLTFKDVTVKNGDLISIVIDKLGYKFEGVSAQNVEIIEDKEPGQPKPAPNPDLDPKPMPKPEPNPEPVPPPVPNPDKEQDPKKPEDNNVQNQGGGSARSSVRPDAAAATTIKEEPAPKAPSPESKNANSVITLKIGSKEYQVMENGELVTKMMDVAPKVHKGATLLPARMIADILGVNIKYDAATKKVSFSYNEGNEAQLTLGENFMMIHGERMELTSESMIENGRVLLPLGDVQKAFSKIGLEAKIAWNADAKTITIER